MYTYIIYICYRLLDKNKFATFWGKFGFLKKPLFYILRYPEGGIVGGSKVNSTFLPSEINQMQP